MSSTAKAALIIVAVFGIGALLASQTPVLEPAHPRDDG